jgi:hypothetical protein
MVEPKKESKIERNFTDDRDGPMCDKAFYYGAGLLFGRNNAAAISQYKGIFEDKVEKVTTIPWGERGERIGGNIPGMCILVPTDDRQDYGLQIEMMGHRNAPQSVSSWLRHEFMHEFAHAHSDIAALILARHQDGVIASENGRKVLKKNTMGIIMERFFEADELKGYQFYGQMINETMMDMIAQAELVAFEGGSRNISLDDVFLRRFNDWSDAKSGYTTFTSLTRLMLTAFSNNGFYSFQKVFNDGGGIFTNTTKMKDGAILKSNDFMYGIMCDPLHIEIEFDKYMGQGKYRELSNDLDSAFGDYLKDGYINKDGKIRIKIAMFLLSDFLNRKTNDYLATGRATERDVEKIKTEFNKIWQPLQTEYKVYFSEIELEKIRSDAGRNEKD